MIIVLYDRYVIPILGYISVWLWSGIAAPRNVCIKHFVRVVACLVC